MRLEAWYHSIPADSVVAPKELDHSTVVSLTAVPAMSFRPFGRPLGHEESSLQVCLEGHQEGPDFPGDDVNPASSGCNWMFLPY
jgi:hypothetical protein